MFVTFCWKKAAVSVVGMAICLRFCVKASIDTKTYWFWPAGSVFLCSSM